MDQAVRAAIIEDGNRPAKLNQAFDATGITWHNRANALARFREGRDIVWDNGEPFALYDSALLPLHDSLSRWAYDNRNPEVFDGRTIPRDGVGPSRPGLASKADYPDRASKVRYIEANGEEAWARLPLSGVSTSEVLTREDFLRLPSAEKVKRYAADEHAFTRLPNAPKAHPFEKALGQREQMAANLALDVAKRGGRR